MTYKPRQNMSNCTCEKCPVKELVPFKTLTTDELNALADGKDTFRIMPGDPLFLEGEHMNGIYCVRAGIAKLTKLNINGQDQIVKLIAPGTLLGQEAMLTHDPANLSAIALEEMEVCFIPKLRMISFISGNPQFSMDIIKTISASLREADEQLVAITHKTVKQRMADTLIYLYDAFEPNKDNSLRVKLTREELAGMMGIATETCIRILSELNKEGCIELAGKKITITDRERLVRYK